MTNQKESGVIAGVFWIFIIAILSYFIPGLITFIIGILLCLLIGSTYLELRRQNYKYDLEKSSFSKKLMAINKILANYFFQKKIPIQLVGLGLGGFVFFLIYGSKILDTSYINWIMGGNDLTQHYLGWHFFRSEHWSFPIGKISSWYYPQGTSVIYTDSIPIFALLFKVISPLLPSTFQYQGLWIFISYLLLGFFSALLLKQISKNPICTILGVMFFLLNPIILYRLGPPHGHESLTSHWIILASIYLYFQPYKMKYFIFWTILLTAAVMIHFYIFTMAFILFLAYLLKLIFTDNKKKYLILASLIFGIVAIIFTIMWLVGYFVINFGSSDAIGFGWYSVNLLSIINPHDPNISIFLKNIQVPHWQHEGFSYLGFGAILLVILSIYELLRQKIALNLRLLSPLLFIVFIFFIMSLSNNVYIGNYLLFSIELPVKLQSLLSIFRSSGRFIWPIYYLLILLAIYMVLKYNKPKNAIAILVILLSIQIIDLHKYLINFRLSFVDKPTYYRPIKAETWNRLIKKSEHIIIIPAEWDNELGYTFGFLAAEHKSTLNIAYLARKSEEPLNKYTNETIRELNQGEIRKDTLYVFKKNTIENFLKIKTMAGSKASNHLWGKLDGFFVIAPLIELSESDLVNFKKL